MTEKLQLYSFVPLLMAAEFSSLIGRPAAIGAFNVNFYAQGEGILEGLRKAEAPGVIQASKGANKFQGGADKIQYMVLKAMENMKITLPICLHLDHGDEKSAIDCINKGFSSVMIDASELDELDNMAVTRKIVDYAHTKGIGVEAEYGKLKGVEEHISYEKTTYADPKFVPVFFDRSKADALAIAYGTSHGPNKGKTDALNISIVAYSYAGLKAYNLNLDHFLVSHGSSSIPQKIVEEINQYGGLLKNTSGVPDYIIKQAITSGIRKVNIDTDLRLAITAVFRKYLHDNPGVEQKSDALNLVKKIFSGEIPARDKDGKAVNPAEITDPRSYLQPVMDLNPELLREDYRSLKDSAFVEVMELVKNRIAEHVKNLAILFGSAGLAGKVDTRLTLEEMANKYLK
ncbi:class II fructose-bisphosphate aldolase [Candidatus Woesearchaeota archaeon]|nr:class II fructose-bisphosphate aldolase [Candidatus Woesearchaeota archaeon]